jgi:peptidoglycan hydrolase-like protein with peptidoglycan-binding domain
VQSQLAGNAATTVALHAPIRPGFLAGAPPPLVMAKPPPAPIAAPVPPSTLVPATPPPPTPVAAKPLVPMPDEARMTDADRREVQTALVRLGYYDNPIDGLFGPETRAAIRRYQHEIGGEITGRLTAEQASRLVNTP